MKFSYGPEPLGEYHITMVSVDEVVLVLGRLQEGSIQENQVTTKARLSTTPKVGQVK
jgi:hypothetical protein